MRVHICPRACVSDFDVGVVGGRGLEQGSCVRVFLALIGKKGVVVVSRRSLLGRRLRAEI
jgi:hypothetical protein